MGGLGGGTGLEELLLELAATATPRVCFLGTASAHKPEHVEWFYDRFRGRPCEPAHVELFESPERPAEEVARADVVFVAGGNTANALALWRVHGVDGALRAVWERGGVLGGWSAGGICWFEDGLTDSFGPLRPLGDGLGFLGGSFCPHYDGEVERRPAYLQAVRDGALAPGYAADDDAALHFEGTELREVVTQREGARAYRVTVDGEEPLDARLL
jgi:dipeptidase E